MSVPYIIDAIRTPIGNLGGALSKVRADDMAAAVIAALLSRNPNLPAADVSDVVLGCANQAGEDNRNVARMALLLAGMPVSVPGETVNRLCASGMSAVINAARAIVCGDGDAYIAGGVEQMTRAPWVISKVSQAFGRDAEMYDSSFGWRFINSKMQQLYGIDSMGMTAENLADKYNIDRQSQDEFALWSQQKADEARTTGRLAQEIVPVEVSIGKGQKVSIAADEFLKPQTTYEALAKLKPAFKAEGGSVTAGNSSGLNDGAAALLLASEQGINRYGFRPLAKIIGWGSAGVEPRIMGIGPVPASAIALQKAELRLADMDIIELNEAFAVQCLACIRAWGLADNDARINPNGGAIALGHPLGMSGARIIQSAALQLHITQKKYALCTMCIGVGQGYAVVLERA